MSGLEKMLHIESQFNEIEYIVIINCSPDVRQIYEESIIKPLVDHYMQPMIHDIAKGTNVLEKHAIRNNTCYDFHMLSHDYYLRYL